MGDETDYTRDDDNLTDLIIAARNYAEGYQNRPLITQTWQLYLDEWPRHKKTIELKPGLQSVTSVKYTSPDGTEATFSADSYEVDAKSIVGKIVLKKGVLWPTVELKAANGICIEFVCGYGDADAVPDLTKRAMLKWIVYQYANPDGNDVPDAVNRLLSFERVMPV